MQAAYALMQPACSLCRLHTGVCRLHIRPYATYDRLQAASRLHAGMTMGGQLDGLLSHWQPAVFLQIN